MNALPLLDLGMIILIFALISMGQGTLANVLIVSYLGLTIYKSIPIMEANRGSRAFNAGDNEKALMHFKKASEHRFTKPYIRANYGYLLMRAGKLEEAEAILTELTQVKTRDDRFKYKNHINLAILQWKKGDTGAAIAKMEEIQDTYKNTLMYEILGYLYLINGDNEKALEFNHDAHQFNPEDNVISANLAQSYYALGKKEKAMDLYEEIIETVNFPEAHYYFGKLKWEAGDYITAREAFEKTLIMPSPYLSSLTEEDYQANYEAFKAAMEAENVDWNALLPEDEEETPHLLNKAKEYKND